MSKKYSKAKNPPAGIERIGLALLAGYVLVLTVIAVYEGVVIFYHTSYRLVSVFLILILSSNILAKIALAYFKTFDSDEQKYA